MLVLLLVKCKHGMRWAKCSLFSARKFVRTVYLRGWLRCPINLPVNIWKVRWNVNTLQGSTVHNKNKTVMDAGSWGLVVFIRWFQPMRVRTRFLFLVASRSHNRSSRISEAKLKGSSFWVSNSATVGRGTLAKVFRYGGCVPCGHATRRCIGTV